MSDFTSLFTAAVNTTIAQQVAVAMAGFQQRQTALEEAIHDRNELMAAMEEALVERDRAAAVMTERIKVLEEAANEQNNGLESAIEHEVKSQLEDYVNNEIDIEGAIEKAFDNYDFSSAVAESMDDREVERSLTEFIREFDFMSCQNFDQAACVAVYNKMAS